MEIKNIARQKGMRLEDIAKEIGITKGGLSKALNGNPTIGTLRKVAEVLDVPITDFFADEIGDVPHPEREPLMRCPRCGQEIKIELK